MLIDVDSILGGRIKESDAELGVISDLLFDDHAWVVRYLVVDTGTWLSGRQVLIAPVEVKNPDWKEGIVPVGLTADQIEQSPPLESELPISRRKEAELAQYFGWALTGFGPEVADMAIPNNFPPPEEDGSAKSLPEGPGLRSCKAVEGYRIHAEDGEIGHVEDYIVEPNTWRIRYLVVDTRNWLRGKRVLVDTKWIDRVEWESAKVFTEITKEGIRNSPEYDRERLGDDDYERALCEPHGKTPQ